MQKRHIASTLLLLTGLTACSGSNPEQASPEQAFHAGMEELLADASSKAREEYESKGDKSFEYAQQICSSLDVKPDSLNFDDTEYGTYMSYSPPPEYTAAVLTAAIFELCPEHKGILQP